MSANPRAALRDALVDYAEIEDRAGLHAAAARLAEAAELALTWMELNGIDPDDPPSCACGGEHWTCNYGEH